MDYLSLLVFFIFAVVILIMLVYISPIISALVMLVVPLASIYLVPEQALWFFSMQQVSFMGVPIYNVHILLLVYSAILGIAVYSELLSWYLLIDETRTSDKREKTAEEPPEPAKDKKSIFLWLGKIMSGGK